jgi:hypothetical protein
MRRLAFSTAALGRFVLIAAGPCEPHKAPVVPRDPTLHRIVDHLTGPALCAIIWISFIARVLDYALAGEFGGVCVAFSAWYSATYWHHVVQIMPQQKGNVMKSRVVNIKIPAEIERVVEAESASRSLTIGELVCEALLAKYDHHANARVEQLLYETVRIRLILQHYIDHTQSSELTDGIREAANREAQQYLARLRDRR